MTDTLTKRLIVVNNLSGDSYAMLCKHHTTFYELINKSSNLCGCKSIKLEGINESEGNNESEKEKLIIIPFLYIPLIKMNYFMIVDNQKLFIRKTSNYNKSINIFYAFYMHVPEKFIHKYDQSISTSDELKKKLVNMYDKQPSLSDKIITLNDYNLDIFGDYLKEIAEDEYQIDIVTDWNGDKIEISIIINKNNVNITWKIINKDNQPVYLRFIGQVDHGNNLVKKSLLMIPPPYGNWTNYTTILKKNGIFQIIDQFGNMIQEKKLQYNQSFKLLFCTPVLHRKYDGQQLGIWKICKVVDEWYIKFMNTGTIQWILPIGDTTIVTGCKLRLGLFCQLYTHIAKHMKITCNEIYIKGQEFITYINKFNMNISIIQTFNFTIINYFPKIFTKLLCSLPDIKIDLETIIKGLRQKICNQYINQIKKLRDITENERKLKTRYDTTIEIMNILKKIVLEAQNNIEYKVSYPLNSNSNIIQDYILKLVKLELGKDVNILQNKGLRLIGDDREKFINIGLNFLNKLPKPSEFNMLNEQKSIITNRLQEIIKNNNWCKNLMPPESSNSNPLSNQSNKRKWSSSNGDLV